MVPTHNTTTRAKLKTIKQAFNGGGNIDTLAKVKSYIAQVNLYGWAVSRSLGPVQTVGITFICRDGVGDNDIWDWSAPYNEKVACVFWDRVLRLWNEVQEGKPLDQFDTHDGCWYCANYR